MQNLSRLTSREFLYHLPCEPSVRKLDGFGRRWLAPETALWTNRVGVPPPTLCQDLRFRECVEQLAVETLRPHVPIERFDRTMFPGDPGSI
jgi:hypothetical protein